VAGPAEHDVVALPGQQHAAIRQVDPEPAADQQDGRGAGVGGDPLGALLAGRVDAPLDLDVAAVPQVAGRHEVAQQPAPVARRVGRRAARVHLARARLACCVRGGLRWLRHGP
jgi:hypothetical protein